METDDDLKTSMRLKRDLTRHAAPDALRQRIRQDIAEHLLAHPDVGWHLRVKNWFLSTEKKMFKHCFDYFS